MGQIEMKRIAERAKKASAVLRTLPEKKRNEALSEMARCLVEDTGRILKANRRDLAGAEAAGLSSAMIARLKLDEKKIREVARGLKEIRALADPVGRQLERTRRPNGLVIRKVSVPIGVILIIFESRPNVTADCAGLCLKSGNSVILRGGKEAFHSNRAIHRSLQRALRRRGIPVSAVEFVTSPDRSDVDALLGLEGLIDVVIPRGGKSLIRKVAELSRIPVLKHYQGICHVYVDAEADLNMALEIADNAKTQNPGVCNAMETLLVDAKIAPRFLPPLAARLTGKGVRLCGCARTRTVLKGIPAAKASDWATEYLDLTLSIRVVDGVDGAIRHIGRYGSDHTEAIVSRNAETRRRFLAEVDSACVFENASTRFSDGGEFGMGAEMGISTDKLHARGPVGLRELTTYKYVVSGTGQIRT